MRRAEIIFTLDKTLRELEITKNKLSVESKVRPATIADMVNGNVKAIQLDTLTSILNALNRLSINQGKKKRYDIRDVFIYVLDNDINSTQE